MANDGQHSAGVPEISSPTSTGQAQLVGLERLTRRHREAVSGRLFATTGDPAQVGSPAEGVDLASTTHRRGNMALSTLALTWKRMRGRLVGAPVPADCGLVREAYAALNACIGCRACGQECPLKKDLPQLKDCFVEVYHQAREPSPADGIVAGFEIAMPWVASAPRWVRRALESRLAGRLFRSAFGVTDLPRVAPRPLRALLRERSQTIYSPEGLAQLPPAQLERAVVVVQDVFTSFLEPQVVLATLDLLEALAYRPLMLRYYPTGRGLQIRGYAAQAARAAQREAEALRRLGKLGLPLVGLDPVVTLGRNTALQRDHADVPSVALLQDWLCARLAEGTRLVPAGTPTAASPRPYWLLPHCSEREIAADVDDGWQRVFHALGLKLEIWASGCRRSASTGSCELNGAATAPEGGERARGAYLATGYPCRRELSKDTLGPVRHPVEVLAELVRT